MASSHLHWANQPVLHEPVLIAAFAGWNDAGDAATTAIGHLARRWDATAFATVDAEPFYDFSSTRPLVRLDDHGERSVVWPGNEFAAASPGRDVVLLEGIEPQLQWRTFCEQVVDVARTVGARMVVTLGALLTETPHTKPTVVFGTTEDADLRTRLGLQTSDYQGPTGIVGALHVACREAGLQSASLWAAVPTYVSGATSPKAALALVERVGELLSVPVPVTDLQIAAASYERQIDELVRQDDDLAGYVAQLEERYDDQTDEFDEDDDEDEDDIDAPPLDAGGGDALVAEVERFLREQGRG
jgi:proteasome assembly chaperone (PAC2) family protein